MEGEQAIDDLTVAEVEMGCLKYGLIIFTLSAREALWDKFRVCFNKMIIAILFAVLIGLMVKVFFAVACFVVSVF